MVAWGPLEPSAAPTSDRSLFSVRKNGYTPSRTALPPSRLGKQQPKLKHYTSAHRPGAISFLMKQ